MVHIHRVSIDSYEVDKVAHIDFIDATLGMVRFMRANGREPYI